MIRNLLAWAADVLIGPACPHRCGHRARGRNTLHDHVHLEHAGDPTPRSGGPR